MEKLHFGPSEKEVLSKYGNKFYVYALVDPRDNTVFYIGKGQGDRVFEHVNGVMGIQDTPDVAENDEQEKARIIKEIYAEGKEVQHFILRWNLTEAEAYSVESVLIDCIAYRDFTLPNNHQLSNVVSGHKSQEFGIVSTSDIALQETATELNLSEVKHNILLLSVGQRYLKGDQSALYDIVRKFWKVSQQKANKMDYVVAIAGQITRGVFKVDELGWRPAEEYEGEYFERESVEVVEAKLEKRRFFSGEEVTDPEITRLYVNKTFKMTQNPVRYIFKDGTIVDEKEN